MINWTTKVTVSTTMGEIHALLAGNGAGEIMTRYQDGHPVGVSFSLDGPQGRHGFTLPVDVEGVAKALRGKPISGGISRAVMESDEHAARVAWRLAKSWLLAQLSLVEARMATLEETMLPYIIVSPDGTTLRQRFAAHGLPELES
jgi:hypothetical protein